MNVTMEFINTLPREEVAQYINFENCLDYCSSIRETNLILTILSIILLSYIIYLLILNNKKKNLSKT